MLFNIYAVKDELANTFLGLNIMESDNEAKRQFKTQINTITLWKENATDFSLFKLGSFDSETGEILYKPEKITGGRSVLNV